MRTATIRVIAAGLLAAVPAAAQLWEVGNQLLWQPGGLADARFGKAVATGDFDHDGYDDLAVGGDRASSGGATAGRVDLYRGGPGGLSNTVWLTIPGEAGSGFGAALAAGDFDGDLRDELAVGAPLHDEPDGSGGVFADAGRVWVFELSGQVWIFSGVYSQAGDGAGALEAGDQVGGALAVGDFDDDGFADLAVGARKEAVGAVQESGAVNVFYGSGSGLVVSGSQIWNFSGELDGAAGTFDGLGTALAAGDFDGDGVDDLAMGADGRTVDGKMGAGSVVILYGVAAVGLDGAGQQEIDLSDLGFEFDSFSHFGATLAAGDFNFSLACAFAFDCADDLAIGAPYQDVETDGGTAEAAGLVHVVRGTDPGGLDPSLATMVDKSALAPSLPAEYGDHLGAALAAGAMDRLQGDDLVVGIPDDDDVFGSIGFLSGAGLPANGVTQRIWTTPALAASPVDFDDQFGASVAIGDFDGDGTGDLAIGVPRRDSPDAFDAGVVQVLYGALFADGLERGSLSGWTTF